MTTRRVVMLAVAALTAMPTQLFAETAKGMPRVAMLFPGSPVQSNALVNTFVRAMRENGYADGRDFVSDLRYFGIRGDELERVVADTIRLEPDLIVTVGSRSAWAAKKATSTTPIVMATVGDPVGQGLVSSLSKPGGNLTGNAIFSEVVIAKRVELLRELLPKANRIAVLLNPSNPVTPIAAKALDNAANRLGLTLLRFYAESISAVDAALDGIARQRPDALVLEQDNVFWLTRVNIAQSMLRHRIPAVHGFKEAVTEGALMSYANSTEEMFQRAAVFVVRILKGARPADLPIEQPTKFELVINLKTARSLGLTIPPSLLLRADQVIE